MRASLAAAAGDSPAMSPTATHISARIELVDILPPWPAAAGELNAQRTGQNPHARREIDAMKLAGRIRSRRIGGMLVHARDCSIKSAARARLRC